LKTVELPLVRRNPPRILADYNCLQSTELSAAEKARGGKMKKEFLKGFTMLSGQGRILP
jgi:hypothetical protein